METHREIDNIRPYQMSNASRLKFFAEALKIILKFNLVLVKINKLYNVFRDCVDKEDMYFKTIRKSNISALKKKNDKERDSLLVGINEALRTALRHFDEIVREAAQRLKIVFDTYNNPKPIKDMPYDEETIAINNLLRELDTKYVDDMQITALTPWIEKLRNSNNAFDKLITEYNEQQAKRPSLDPKEIHKATDKAYQDVIIAIEAFILLEEEEAKKEYEPFLMEFNTLIKHYNDLTAQHLGRIQAEKEREEAEKEEREREEREKREENND
jgi:hypothetical protein